MVLLKFYTQTAHKKPDIQMGGYESKTRKVNFLWIHLVDNRCKFQNYFYCFNCTNIQHKYVTTIKNKCYCYYYFFWYTQKH